MSQRASHSKSRLGCRTCKQRHIKCDENKPICLQCRKKSIQCAWSEPPSTEQAAFRSVIYQPMRKAFTLTEDDCTALSYFQHITLPGLASSDPSPLWSYLSAHLHSEESLCYAAASLGFFHRNASTNVNPIPGEKLQIRALRALRQPAPNQMLLTGCLLLTMLQQLRRSPSEYETHLKHGFVISLDDESTDVEINECKRMLKQSTATTVLFTSLSRSQNDLIDLVGQRTQSAFNKDQSLDQDLQDLILEFLGTFAITGDFLLQDHDPIFRSEYHWQKMHDLQARYAVLEAAVQLRLAERPLSSAGSARLGILNASCLLTGIFMRCAATSLQTSYDDELETFEAIINVMNSTLPEEQATALTIAHGGLCILFFVTLLCRDAVLRRQSMSLMARCPQQDGLWNKEQTIDICKSIIASEERMAADEPGMWMSEHCRVQFFQCLDNTSTLRLFRRVKGDLHTFVYEDVDMARAESRNGGR